MKHILSITYVRWRIFIPFLPLVRLLSVLPDACTKTHMQHTYTGMLIHTISDVWRWTEKKKSTTNSRHTLQSRLQHPYRDKQTKEWTKTKQQQRRTKKCVLDWSAVLRQVSDTYSFVIDECAHRTKRVRARTSTYVLLFFSFSLNSPHFVSFSNLLVIHFFFSFIYLFEKFFWKFFIAIFFINMYHVHTDCQLQIGR